ncbi:MAG: hypothetical protein NW223_12395 [Hyphomicrobiaceae bacterium]|nr:hypothetical protein [Hyphomicrobiaceae bacterium]
MVTSSSVGTFNTARQKLLTTARALPPRAARQAWFFAKSFVGLPTRGDVSFLVEELVARLERGELCKGLHITAAGRTDGAGAQATAAMSALALARTYGLTYVHTPFASMEHSEGASSEDWAQRWEAIFNLGQGHMAAAECQLPAVGLEQFMASPQLWDTPCLVTAGRYVRFTDMHPEALAAIAGDLRARYSACGHVPAARQAGVVRVGVHLRRGDVSLFDPLTAHRAAPLQPLATAISQVKSAARRAGKRAVIRVYSQGDRAELALLEQVGCELALDASACDTFHELVATDVLLMGRSSFSFAAGVIGSGIKIYDPCKRPPLPDWLVRDGQGRLDVDLLAWMLAQQDET